MIEISLTEFVDFVTRSGTPKLTVVRNAKKRYSAPYDPRTDFYKPLRDRLVRHHKRAQSKAALSAIMNGLLDAKKHSAYPALLNGYKRFWGSKRISWFKPPQDRWMYAQLAVSMNPELGLEINGQRHVVKLYFKEPKLTKRRADVVTQLMQLVLGGMGRSLTFSILDIRRSKLISAGPPNPVLVPLLEGEALSFARIYNRI